MAGALGQPQQKQIQLPLRTRCWAERQIHHRDYKEDPCLHGARALWAKPTAKQFISTHVVGALREVFHGSTRRTKTYLEGRKEGRRGPLSWVRSWGTQLSRTRLRQQGHCHSSKTCDFINVTDFLHIKKHEEAHVSVFKSKLKTTVLNSLVQDLECLDSGRTPRNSLLEAGVHHKSSSGAQTQATPNHCGDWQLEKLPQTAERQPPRRADATPLAWNQQGPRMSRRPNLQNTVYCLQTRDPTTLMWFTFGSKRFDGSWN